MFQKLRRRYHIEVLRRELNSLLYRNNDKRLRFVVEDRDRYGKPASTLSFTAVAPPNAGESSISDQIDVSYSIVEKMGGWCWPARWPCTSPAS